MNAWQEVTLTINREAEEAVSNLLIEAGSQGVAISDTADYLGQKDRFGEIFKEVEQSEMVTITAYFPEGVAIEPLKEELYRRLMLLKHQVLKQGQ